MGEMLEESGEGRVSYINRTRGEGGQAAGRGEVR